MHSVFSGLYDRSVNIAYVAHSRFPTEKAHGFQIAHVCAALSALGHSVTLVLPTVENHIRQDPFSYHGVSPTFQLRRLSHVDPWHFGIVPGFLKFPLNLFFYRRALRRFFAAFPVDCIYLRSPFLLDVVTAVGCRVVLELHSLPSRRTRSFLSLCSRCTRIVCLTSPMRDELVSWGVDARRVIVEGDAVDVAPFAQAPEREAARDALGIRTRRFVVGYAGRLWTMGMEKGVATLLRSLALMPPDQRAFAFVVGGPEEAKCQYLAQAAALGLTDDDVRFEGEVPFPLIPTVLSACDTLVMPFPDVPHYRKNMSPLKMFEYMAAQRPIITSDLPTIRDVLSEESAFFFPPGDAQALALLIASVRDQAEVAAAKAREAFRLVSGHTWVERMRRIMQ